VSGIETLVSGTLNSALVAIGTKMTAWKDLIQDSIDAYQDQVDTFLAALRSASAQLSGQIPTEDPDPNLPPPPLPKDELPIGASFVSASQEATAALQDLAAAISGPGGTKDAADRLSAVMAAIGGAVVITVELDEGLAASGITGPAQYIRVRNRGTAPVMGL